MAHVFESAVSREDSSVDVKDLPEQVCDKAVEKYTSCEGYKHLYKALKIPGSTVKTIIKKWKVYGTTHSLPKSGHPFKLDDRERRHLVRGAMQNPMATLKDLQGFMAKTGQHVCHTTISKILHTSGLYEKVVRKKPFLK